MDVGGHGRRMSDLDRVSLVGDLEVVLVLVAAPAAGTAQAQREIEGGKRVGGDDGERGRGERGEW